jgi:hypothetical protein
MEHTKKAPNAQIRYVGVSSYVDNDATMAPGMVFEHVGGDALDLTTLQLDLRLNGGAGAICLVTYNDPPSKRPSLPYLDRSRDVRMEKFGAGFSTADRKNTLLKAGERFIIYAESGSVTSLAYRVDRTDDPNGGNAYSSGAFTMVGGVTEYILSDQNSGKVLARGFCYGEEV